MEIKDLLNFDPADAGMPSVRRTMKKLRPSSAAVKRSRTDKNGSRRRSRPSSAMRSRTRKARPEESANEQLIKDLRQKKRIDYSNNYVDRAKIDGHQDAWQMSKLEREAEVYSYVDKQIRENQRHDEILAEEERQYDKESEEENRRKIREQAERDMRRKNLELAAFHETYLHDMENRRLRIVNEATEKERDRQHIAKLTREYEDEKRRKKEEKAKRARRLKSESIKYTRKQAQLRLKKAKDEQEEEDRLVAFQKRKVARENAVEHEKALRKKEAELLTAKLRAKQQKSQDTQAQRDEELMIRYQRDHALKQLRKIRKEKAERDRRSAEVMATRLRQVREKAEQVAKEAEMERNQHQKMMELQEAEKARVSMQEHRRREKKEKYRQELLAQIAENEAARTKAAQENKDTSNITRAVEDECTTKALEEARQTKLRHLRKSGVPDHYVQRLSAYKFNFV